MQIGICGNIIERFEANYPFRVTNDLNRIVVIYEMFFKGNAEYYFWLNMRHTGDDWVHLGTGYIQSSYWHQPSKLAITNCGFYNSMVVNAPLGSMPCGDGRHVMCHLWVPSC